MVEYLALNQGVVGSNPIAPTNEPVCWSCWKSVWHCQDCTVTREKKYVGCDNP